MEIVTIDEVVVREDKSDVLSSWLDDWNIVVVGTDTTLSIAADMAYTGERSDENFGSFSDILGIDRMILPSRERFRSDGQYWASEAV